MQIIINTIEGTFVVPAEKQAELVYWLKQNAVKVGQQTVKEQTGSQFTGTQLING
jgi:hypothetical protein